MGKGEFEKRAQDIANYVPLGILDELHKKHNVWLPDSFLKIVREAKKEFPIPNIEFIEDPKLEEFAKGLNKKQLEWFEKWFGKGDEEGTG